MKSTAYAELAISCKNRNLIALDSITGLKHSKYHEIGSITINNIKLDYSSWTFKTKIVEICYTEELTDSLLEILIPSIEKLEDFIKRNECQTIIYVVMHEIGDTLPSLSLNSNIINLLYRLRSSFAFDGVYLQK